MKKIIILLIILISNALVYADTGESGIPSLMFDAYGARQMALAETFVGLSDDINSISVNPAGLNTLESMEGSVMYMRHPLEMNFFYLAFGSPLEQSSKKGYLAGSLTVFSLPGFEEYDSTGNKTGNDLSASDFILSLAYANNPLTLIDRNNEHNLNVGVTAKFIRTSLVEDSASTLAFDLGFLYKFAFYKGGTKKSDDNLGIGVSVQNIGGSVTYAKQDTQLPQNFKIGWGYKFYEDRYHSLVNVLDVNLPNDSDIITSTGLEYTFIQMISTRIGYKITGRETESFSFGLGGKYSLMNKLFKFDYAFIPMSDFGSMHSFNIGMSF